MLLIIKRLAHLRVMERAFTNPERRKLRKQLSKQTFTSSESSSTEDFSPKDINYENYDYLSKVIEKT
jgi:hypothetical protein